MGHTLRRVPWSLWNALKSLFLCLKVFIKYSYRVFGDLRDFKKAFERHCLDRLLRDEQEATEMMDKHLLL